MKKLFACFWCVLFATSIPVSAAVLVNSSTAEWTAITYLNPEQADPSNDEQASSRDGDLVGNSGHAAFYTDFSDAVGTPAGGQIGFRVRVAGDSNPTGFSSNVWVGLDVNFDGKLDIFVGADEDVIGIYRAGNDLNTSPSTTSINTTELLPHFTETATTASNFSFTPVTSMIDPTATNFNLDNGSGGGADHADRFVSFVLPFANLQNAINSLGIPGVGTNFTKDSGLRYVVATGNNGNNINQDLNGVNGGIGSSTSWTQLNGFSNPVTSTGAAAIPEPSALGLALTGSFLLLKRDRRLRV